MRRWEKGSRNVECGSGNKKEVGKENAECGMRKWEKRMRNSEVGIRKDEKTEGERMRM